MVHGLFSKKRWLLLIPIMFLAVWMGVSVESSLRAEETESQEAEPMEEAGQDLSGLDLIEAHHRKIQEIRRFQTDRGLLPADLQLRKSRAADELNRLIGGLESLMRQEAERMYERAMNAADPKERDRVLQELRDTGYAPLQDVRRRAENELNPRTVEGTVYPTLEEAEAQREPETDEREKQAEQDQKDLKAVEQLKQDVLTDPIAQAAQAFAENEAREMLESALRLVLPQRREMLKEIARKHPDTKAAGEAGAILEALKQHNEWVASRKLHAALQAPVCYSQRWRRLKEIERDHAHTQAALEAQRIFEQHLAQIPPVVITNHAADDVELTVDKPYSRLEEAQLSPSETRTFQTAFPLTVRIKIAEHEWTVYRVWPGWNYVLEAAPNNVPVLHPAP